MIVVLVILAILASIAIPAMTGWLDKANEKRLSIAYQACVTAAQTLVAEEYAENHTATPPDGAVIAAFAEETGIINGVSIDAASHTIRTLTYSEGADSVTYLRLPSPGISLSWA